MKVSLFDFELPASSIALRPAEPRDASRLLSVNENCVINDHQFLELADLLVEGDALVFNDTKVIPARLFGERIRDGVSAKVEITLHQRQSPDCWASFIRGAKKLRVGDIIYMKDGSPKATDCSLSADVVEKGEAGEVLLKFNAEGDGLDALIAQIGDMPLPPYIASQREEDERDDKDYQTIYAKHSGAVAAPTAGLHFTDRVFEKLDAKGISRHFVTLHVGAGTFLPVKSDDTDGHKMHHETGEIDLETAEALNEVRRRGGRIVSVGTTSLRLLESASDENGRLQAWRGSTDIFITPGYKFRIVDQLLTNFHLPKSTLFMLVSAFCGRETMLDAYAHAIKSGYRFYSYGDCNLLTRSDTT